MQVQGVGEKRRGGRVSRGKPQYSMRGCMNQQEAEEILYLLYSTENIMLSSRSQNPGSTCLRVKHRVSDKLMDKQRIII